MIIGDFNRPLPLSIQPEMDGMTENFMRFRGGGCGQ